MHLPKFVEQICMICDEYKAMRVLRHCCHACSAFQRKDRAPYYRYEQESGQHSLRSLGFDIRVTESDAQSVDAESILILDKAGQPADRGKGSAELLALAPCSLSSTLQSHCCCISADRHLV